MNNCNDIREQLFLYDEINDEIKRDVDSHLNSCEDCQVLFRELEAFHSTIKSASIHTPEVPNPVWLTNAVLSQIEAGRPQKVIVQQKRYSPGWFMSVFRYPMAAMSLVFIGLFYHQYSDGPFRDREQNAVVAEKGPVLNTKNFETAISKWNERKKVPSYLRGCYGPKRSRELIVACLRDKVSFNKKP